MASTTERDGSPHSLSLKVMRVSRPEFASSWQPFYSSSPSFSAHSTASIVSLQGSSPLPGHPKTLRDLTHTSELLMLPPSFGNIQLGEVFCCCLCVNNEANLPVESVTLKIEMQTASSKTLIAEIGSPELTLAAMETTQCLVTHEIKELGQHVLGCTVGYRSSIRGGIDEVMSFRKFYKFSVTNPLSVKTKVHLTRSPITHFLLTERDKLFMEVHIQNLTHNPLYFETMRFEPDEDWVVHQVANMEEETLGTPPLHPQDVRQYLYILSCKQQFTLPATHPPGTMIALGRMELVWRSAFGEPGRLLTSTLSRRIPAQAASIPPVSALPPHLHYIPHVPTPRPQSPVTSSRAGTPPMPRQDLSLVHPPSPPLLESQVTLLVQQAPPHCIHINQVFSISLTLIVVVPHEILPAYRDASALVVQVVQPNHSPWVQVPVLCKHNTMSVFSTPVSFAAPIHNQPFLSPKVQLAELIDPLPIQGNPCSTQALKPIGSSAFHFPIGSISQSSSYEYNFQIKYVSPIPGLHTIPGLCVLLLSKPVKQNMDVAVSTQILKDWDSLGTIWVSS